MALAWSLGQRRAPGGLRTGVAFSPDGRLLASVSRDGTVFWQDVRTWRRWGTL